MITNNVLIIISPGFAASENDTTCMPAMQVFIKSLNKLFPNLKIIILPITYPYHNKKYMYFGNLVVPFNGIKYWKILRPFLWLKVFKKLYTLKQNEKNVAILSFWCTEAALVGHYFSKIFSLTHRIWLLGQDAKKGNSFVKLINPSADELIGLSSFLCDQFLLNHNIKPRYCISNGIDPESFEETKIEDRIIDILGVGSLIPLKQYNIFIDVVHHLKSYFPAITAVICGKGPEETALRSKISYLGLEDNVTLSGELPHRETLKLMQRSKILLHPSNYEGYSTVCLEALYAGCYVLSFISPEKIENDRWQIAVDADDLKTKCLATFSIENKDHSSLLIHSIEESATQMMDVLNYESMQK